jgi:hypothetical protein
MGNWNIKGAVNAIKRPVNDRLDLMADVFVGYIEPLTPVDTGDLAGATQWKVPREYVRRVFNNKDYAIWVEYGTPPHRITAKNKKALMFELNEGDGMTTIVWVKSVMHPGTAPIPFFRTGVNNAKKAIKRMI